MSAFFFTLINNVFLYFLNTLFIGVTLAAIQGEYTNEMLQIKPPAEESLNGDKRGRGDHKAISNKRTFTKNCKSLAMWLTTWMPLTWIQVIDRYGEEDEDEIRELDELLDGPNHHNHHSGHQSAKSGNHGHGGGKAGGGSKSARSKRK